MWTLSRGDTQLSYQLLPQPRGQAQEHSLPKADSFCHQVKHFEPGAFKGGPRGSSIRSSGMADKRSGSQTRGSTLAGLELQDAFWLCFRPSSQSTHSTTEAQQSWPVLQSQALLDSSAANESRWKGPQFDLSFLVHSNCSKSRAFTLRERKRSLRSGCQEKKPLSPPYAELGFHLPDLPCLGRRGACGCYSFLMN